MVITLFAYMCYVQERMVGKFHGYLGSLIFTSGSCVAQLFIISFYQLREGCGLLPPAAPRFEVRVRCFAPVPGAPVSQASGLLLVLLYWTRTTQANTPHVRTHLQYKRARFGLALIAADQSPNKHYVANFFHKSCPGSVSTQF